MARTARGPKPQKLDELDCFSMSDTGMPSTPMGRPQISQPGVMGMPPHPPGGQVRDGGNPCGHEHCQKNGGRAICVVRHVCLVTCSCCCCPSYDDYVVASWRRNQSLTRCLPCCVVRSGVTSCGFESYQKPYILKLLQQADDPARVRCPNPQSSTLY